jgi:phosphoribosylpyrophosphate synthetase
MVAEKSRSHVQGRHVLVVDDTSVSGDKGQSAALALKAAGARAVTLVCVARWLSANNSIEHEQLIKTAAAPYDALLCPVTGGQCPPPMPAS